ncbi:MAG: cytochrome c biogenesis CcdA family protein [Acidimicrobiia bacterium]
MSLAEVTPDNVGLLVAFGGGIVSFLSPCVLPILPGYLSLITGVSVGELRDTEGGGTDTKTMTRIALNTGLFVAGFTVVFVLLFLTSVAISDVVFRNQETLRRVAGALVILFAVYLAGTQLVSAPRLYGEARFHPSLSRFGPLAAPVAGAAFGLGWTPCLGPVLGSVLAVASTQGETGRGAALLIAYSLGLGVPFLLAGLALGRLEGVFGWFQRHSKGITLFSAAVLGLFGVILFTGNLPRVTARITDVLDALGLERLVELG